MIHLSNDFYWFIIIFKKWPRNYLYTVMIYLDIIIINLFTCKILYMYIYTHISFLFLVSKNTDWPTQYFSRSIGASWTSRKLLEIRYHRSKWVLPDGIFWSHLANTKNTDANKDRHALAYTREISMVCTCICIYVFTYVLTKGSYSPRDCRDFY